MRRRELTIDGDAPITIGRDDNGVVRVRASTEADLYRGLGYSHGADRGLQMLLTRIVAQGRATELLRDSDEMMEFDRFFRRMNFNGGTQREADKLSRAHRGIAEAYCDGVNHAIRRRPLGRLGLLASRSEPWTLADSMLMSRVIGYVMIAQSQGDMERLLVELVQGGVPLDHLEELFPGLLDGLKPSLIAEVELTERLLPSRITWSELVPPGLGSNNWALAPRKTAAGAPLLANDPHLEVSHLPPVWYEVVLELGDRFCIAATMPGLPAALVGRTNALAWGVTYSCADAHDSWIEDCRDGCYRRVIDGDERWVPFTVRKEIIKRRRKPATTLTFYENEHGILAGDPSRAGTYLATRWSCTADTGAASLSAILQVLHIDDVVEGMDALGRIETSWNWVVADRSGNIGYQMSGLVPIRRDGWRGLVPAEGWDPANDWQGFIKPSALPRALNPESGFIVTANDDLNHLGDTKPISLAMGGDRAERIADLLAAREDWDVPAIQEMQMDVYSRQAERFMSVLRPLLPKTPQGDILARWDCRYDLDSRGAYLFEKFYRRLVEEVVGGVCGHEVVRYLLDETGMLAAFYANFDRVLLNADSVWLGREGRDELFSRVAGDALRGPVKPWSSEQQVVMRYLLFGGALPSWLGFDYGPIPLRGGRATIHQGQIFRAGGRETSAGPSYRLVADLGDDAAHTSLAGGQSERRLSRWYSAGIEDWFAGRFKTLRGP